MALTACGNRVVKCTTPPGSRVTVLPSAVISSSPSKVSTSTGIAAVCSESSSPASKENRTTLTPSARSKVLETVEPDAYSISLARLLIKPRAGDAGVSALMTVTFQVIREII
uniref:Uncharacterized protein n=1 Tax=Arcanobacterium haemolyticum (strain ATCC 9345 / DSM 20595 / CCM 5947 / CCUG 17215 / LMG 16163 / NBRC 15585 / NCTC 8452 / 11018) TaxID=644284 RepID=E0WC47_ARCHD|nr:unknown [Arcanobacterium haemolyticum DSM 20595]